MKQYHRNASFPSVGILKFLALGAKVYLCWYFFDFLGWEAVLGFGGNFGCWRFTLAFGGLL